MHRPPRPLAPRLGCSRLTRALVTCLLVQVQRIGDCLLRVVIDLGPEINPDDELMSFFLLPPLVVYMVFSAELGNEEM